MTEHLPRGIKIADADDRVTITVDGGRWEGTAAEAERVFTGLHYALARARPGTNIASVFVNGGLWGEKFFEEDPEQALHLMRLLIARLGKFVEEMDVERSPDA
jgi:hypothetical protein